jgi:hypothetical protein
MYFYDPDRGKRRRALVRDKMVHTLNETAATFDTAVRDLSNQTQGLFAEATSLLTLDPVSDETLVARVRARMGHLISNPHAIQVRADNGRITLSGPILASEEHTLLEGISIVRGVRSVEDQLDVHLCADRPELQGHRPRQKPQSTLDPANWNPTARLVASAVGGLMMLYGVQRKGPSGAATVLGLGLLLRTLREQEVRRMLSPGYDPTAWKSVWRK